MLHQNAKRLRKEQTEAEKKLWHALRARQIEGYKFRRQHVFEPYILDFVCLKAKLVIEVDGGQHADSKKDKVRDAYLQKNGFVVLRFWNNEVLENVEGVLLRIQEALSTPSQPSP